MPDPRRLLVDEQEGWMALHDVLAAIPPDRRADPTVTPDGWTPIVVLGHVAAWLAEGGRVLEAIAAGTWDEAAEPEETPASLAAVNAEHAARAAALTWSEAEAVVAAARTRARAAWGALDEITPAAWSWFEETGPNHYAKHVHDLTAWLAGTASDPEIGRLLQDDAEGWVAFGRLVESIDHGLRDEEGWSTVDICHHLAAWMDEATPLVAENRGFGELDFAGFNARTLEASRGRTFGAARLDLDEARGRLRAALTSLAAPSEGAKQAFFACTVEHYDEHLPMLRRLTGAGEDVP